MSLSCVEVVCSEQSISSRQRCMYVADIQKLTQEMIGLRDCIKQ